MFLTRFRAISASAVPPALGRGVEYALFQSACLGNIAGDRIHQTFLNARRAASHFVRTIFTAVTIFKVARLCRWQLIQFCQSIFWMHKIQEWFDQNRSYAKAFFPSRVQALEITIQTSNTQQIDRGEEAIAFLLRPFTLGDVRLNANEVE